MTKQAVLALLASADAPVSGEEMCRALGVSRAAVWKAIEALRAEGYEIEAAPRRGYALRACPLSRAAIAARLEKAGWQPELIVLQQVDSTNNDLKARAASGAPDETAVLAIRQSAGRGRRGRSFLSEEGGLYLSFLIRPHAAPQALLHLTALAGLCVCRAVEQVCGLRPEIKWPNDPVLGGKKLCGILTELSVSMETREAEYVVIGIGINCNQRAFPPELSLATSLRMVLGRAVDGNELAAALLLELHRMRQEFLTHKAQWVAAFAAQCLTVGKDVQLLQNGALIPARAVSIGPDAELQVVYPDGTAASISSGEVSVRGLYGYV